MTRVVEQADSVAVSAGEAILDDRTLSWKITQLCSRVLTTLMFDLRTYGRENIPRRGGVLLASNHQSNLDPLFLAVQLRRSINYMAKQSLFSNPIFGTYLRSLDAFPVRRGEGDVAAVKEAIARLQQGRALAIFAEGHRTKTGQMLPIQKGVALIVRKAGVPVVPVAVHGAFEAFPAGTILPRPHAVRVMYGKPIDFGRASGEHVVQTLQTTIQSMLEQLREISEREKK